MRDVVALGLAAGTAFLAYLAFAKRQPVPQQAAPSYGYSGDQTLNSGHPLQETVPHCPAGMKVVYDNTGEYLVATCVQDRVLNQDGGSDSGTVITDERGYGSNVGGGGYVGGPGDYRVSNDYGSTTFLGASGITITPSGTAIATIPQTSGSGVDTYKVDPAINPAVITSPYARQLVEQNQNNTYSPQPAPATEYMWRDPKSGQYVTGNEQQYQAASSPTWTDSGGQQHQGTQPSGHGCVNHDPTYGTYCW